MWSLARSIGSTLNKFPFTRKKEPYELYLHTCTIQVSRWSPHMALHLYVNICVLSIHFYDQPKKLLRLLDLPPLSGKQLTGVFRLKRLKQKTKLHTRIFRGFCRTCVGTGINRHRRPSWNDQLITFGYHLVKLIRFTFMRNTDVRVYRVKLVFRSVKWI